MLSQRPAARPRGRGLSGQKLRPSPCPRSRAARATPPPSLLVITPPPHDPNVPHHDLDDEAEIYRLNVRLNVEYWPTTTSAH